MAIPWLIGIGIGLGAAIYYADDDDDDDDYDYEAERIEQKAQRQRELALQEQREREQRERERQREESIRQHTQAFIYKYNLDDLSVDNMAYLVTNNSDQAVDEFQAAFERTSDFKHLSSQINQLNSELAQIKQLSSSLG